MEQHGSHLVMLAIHSTIVASVITFNFMANVYRRDKYKISNFGIRFTKLYTLKHIEKVIYVRTGGQDFASPRELNDSSNKEEVVNEIPHRTNGPLLVNPGIGSNVSNTYYTCFTNEVLDKDDYSEDRKRDSDGNLVDPAPALFTSNTAKDAIHMGYSRMENGMDADTICGSYEKRNALVAKQLLSILSNALVASYLSVTSHYLPTGWEVVAKDVSWLLTIVTYFVAAALLWQLKCMMVCVTTQILVENMSKLGIKVAHVLSGKTVSTDTVRCWYATSVHVADVTVKFSEKGEPIYRNVEGEMIGKKRQCKFLRDDMEGLMSWMSENAYKLTRCNLTGIFVYYMAVGVTVNGGTGAANGLFVSCMALFVASAWYTLAASSVLVTYGGYLDKLGSQPAPSGDGHGYDAR